MDSLILAGDVGGTKINIACFSPEQGLLSPVTEHSYPTAAFKNFESLIAEFLGDKVGRIAAACFGVAGPVENGRVKTTNIPWDVIDAASIKAHLGIPKVELINDMMAMAHGLSVLKVESYHVLNEGEAGATGNAVLIAAGTGLGESILHWDGKRWHPSPSEGGHTDFGPTNDLEIELLRYMQKHSGRCSYEHVLSGPGLQNIYRFLRDTGRGEEPQWLAERMAQEDPGAVISESALAGKSPLCEQAIEMFVHIYGAEAGNLALKGLATGGVYLGGGIAPKILPLLNPDIFMDGFVRERRLADLLSRMPVKVVLDSKSALYGAAYYASLMMKSDGMD